MGPGTSRYRNVSPPHSRWEEARARNLDFLVPDSGSLGFGFPGLLFTLSQLGLCQTRSGLAKGVRTGLPPRHQPDNPTTGIIVWGFGLRVLNPLKPTL